jgi:DNA-binding NarL/FixJ family response regulator
VTQQLNHGAARLRSSALSRHPRTPTPLTAGSGSTLQAEPPAPPTNQLDWPLRVLIVDDAASTRRLLRGVLECSPEFDVAGEADNGASAIEVADTVQPDVVLLDLYMPVSDGSSALGGLLRVVPDASVIVLSGMDKKAAPPLLAAGAAAFVPKGLAPLELLERLSGIVGRPFAPPTPATGSSAATPEPNSLEMIDIDCRIRAVSDPGLGQALRQQRSGTEVSAADAAAAAGVARQCLADIERGSYRPDPQTVANLLCFWLWDRRPPPTKRHRGPNGVRVARELVGRHAGRNSVLTRT